MARRLDDFKYMVIYNHFRGLIESGALDVGEKLPTEEQIVQLFKVSRITAVRGLERLQQDRYITRLQGSGSYVRNRRAQEDAIKVISFVTSFTGEGREGHLISGIESRLRENGYLLSVGNSHENSKIEKELILNIKDRIQGIILYASNSVDNVDLFESLMVSNYPIIFIDRYPQNLPCISITCDNSDGGYRIGRFFIEQGHRRMAFIYHNLTGLSSERDRLNGFMQAMSEAGIPRRDISTVSVSGHDTPGVVRRVVADLFKQGESAPTALFAVNDHLAMVVWKCLAEHRSDSGHGVLLAGFDDLIGDKIDGPFVTIRQPYTLMGRTAAEMLLDRIENNSYMHNNRVIPVELVRYNI